MVIFPKAVKLLAISLLLCAIYCVNANAYDIPLSTSPAINGKPSGESKPVETYTDSSGLWITFHIAPLGELIITDPKGYKLGLDPKTNTNYKEFSNGRYWSMAIDDDVTGEPDPGAKILEVYQPASGNYQIQVIGIASDTYSLYMSAHSDTLTAHSVTDLRNIPIEPNITHTYNFYFPKTTSDVRFFATGANFYGGAEQDIGTNTNKLLAYVYPAQETITLPKGTVTTSIVVIYDITIIPATFKATLNNTDVTNLFKPTAGGIGSVKLNLNPGNTNTLILSVASNLSGKTTIDTDKLIFIVP